MGPLVTSEKSKIEFKSDISLFERLAKRYPHAVSTLKLQYRMDRQIMELANHLIYGGELKMGREKQQSKFEEPIEFIHVEENTDSTIKRTKDISSEKEALIVSELVQKYQKNDLDIGVITPFNRQMLKIKCNISNMEGVEINTIDRHQ